MIVLLLIHLITNILYLQKKPHQADLPQDALSLLVLQREEEEEEESN